MAEKYFSCSEFELYCEVTADGKVVAQFFGENCSELAKNFCNQANGYDAEHAPAKTRRTKKDDPPTPDV